MIKMLTSLLLVCSGTAVFAQVFTNPDIAFNKAKDDGKNVLLVFSGSDWCIPCIRFDKTILNDSDFVHFASPGLVLLEADFPQRKKIPSPLKTQYELLAEQFNPQGVFPKIVLLDKEKRFLGELPFSDQPPAAFINQVRQLLKQKTEKHH